MTDRELIELAAKAAGIKHDGGDYEAGLNTEDGWWNPLTNDADAFRLAVKLKLLVDVNVSRTYATDADIRHEEINVSHGDDPYAATRRAITRAAAEIGKAMETGK